MGIDKILFRVFNDNEENGGLYFENTQFHTVEPALENLITEFDFHQVQLCAWMIGRRFNWIKESSLLDSQYENGACQQIHKLDLFNPEAVKKIITVFKELASHKVNCILIQDDFTFRYNEGFSTWGKVKFTGISGVPAIEKLMMEKNTPYYNTWNHVKINQINQVLRQIIKGCKMVNSGIKVGMNIYYETPVYPERAEAWYSHNLNEIVNTDIDYIYLMSYHRQIKDEMNLSESRNRLLFKDIVEKAYQICREKLIVKIQLRDWNTGERIPVQEVREYIDLIPSQVQRICFTPVTPDDFDYLKAIIESPIKFKKDGQ